VQEYEALDADAAANAGHDQDSDSDAADAGHDQDADSDAAAAIADEGDEPIADSDAGVDDTEEQTADVNAPPATDGGNGPISAAPRYRVSSRGQALALLEAIGAHFRNAEPSSPIPFLIDRARDLALRDFLSVLSALLPEDALKTINPSGGSVD
jgi:predicted component of type VI protein secretion system